MCVRYVFDTGQLSSEFSIINLYEQCIVFGLKLLVYNIPHVKGITTDGFG